MIREQIAIYFVNAIIFVSGVIIGVIWVALKNRRK